MTGDPVPEGAEKKGLKVLLSGNGEEKAKEVGPLGYEMEWVSVWLSLWFQDRQRNKWPKDL